MSDESRRKKQNDLKKTPGDAGTAEALRHEEERTSDVPLTLLAELALYIGQRVYVEGCRMNYRGVLVRVLTESAGTGSVTLCLDPAYRVGEWGEGGVSKQYEEKMNTTGNRPRLIPWESVLDFGLQQAHWKE